MADLSTLANVKAYLGISDTDSDTILTSLLDRASRLIEKYCRRTLVSTAHREIRDGDGTNELHLRDYPVTALTLLSIGVNNVIQITNANANGGYNASFSVDTTNMTLVIDGGTDAGTDTLVLASYTIATLVDAINALGKGWTATVLLTDLQAWAAAELVTAYGQSCWSPAIACARLPWCPQSDFKLEEAAGIITSARALTRGTRNIVIKYTAGYAAADIPTDLEQICIETVAILYDASGASGGGASSSNVKRERLSDHDIAFADDQKDAGLTRSLMDRLGPYVDWGP